MKIEENIPLAPLTTFHIGGPAQHLAHVQDIKEMREAFAFAKAKGLLVFVLGGGSNVLISDAGFEGLVIKIEIRGIELQAEGEKLLLIAGAGESWDSLVRHAVEEKLWGIENLSGIPGTAGGAVAGNIGAYGQALSQTFEWAEVFDTTSGDIKKFTNEQCGFGYRDSFFKHDTGRHIILRAAFALSAAPAPDLSYKDLRERFNESCEDIAAIREAVLVIRKSKFPDIRLEGTAGSFFKNPIVPADEARRLKEKYPGMPLFDMPETAGVKIPLAWLLDKELTMRGTKMGSARLFEKQPLVIVADKNATARDVAALADMVQKKIKEQFGIKIEKEVRIV